MMMVRLAFNCLISKRHHLLLEFHLMVVSIAADTLRKTTGLWGGCKHSVT